MRDKKLLALLGTLDRQEWTDISWHIRQVVAKTSREAILFEYIKRFKRNLSSSKLEIEAIHKNLFPNIKIQSFRNTFHNLTSAIEEYLAIKDLKSAENEIEFGVLKARVYKKRGLSKQFASEIKLLKKGTNNIEQLEIWENAQLARLYYESYFADIKVKKLKGQNLLKNGIETFKKFVKKLSLIYLAESTDREYLFKEEWNDEFLNISKKETNEMHESSALLFKLYIALKTRSAEDYNEAKAKFIHHKGSLPKDLYFFTLIKLSNLCMYLTDRGLEGYGLDMLYLYDLGLDSGVFLKNKKLSEKRFLNIVDLAYKLGKWTWVDDFRKNWSDKVETDQPKKINALANAYEFFSKKNYEQVLKLLEIGFHTKIDLSLRANWLKLCSLYEVYHDKDDELIYRQIQSFRLYLRRNKKKINDKNMKGSNNLIRIIEMMTDNEDNKEIKSFVDDCTFIIFRSWVKHKIQ